MNTISFFRRSAALGLLAAATACDDLTFPSHTVYGSGRLATETRPVRNLSGVALSTIGTVYVDQGPVERLHIDAESNIIPHIRTRVRGGTLEVDAEPGYDLRPTRPLRIYLTVRDLNDVRLSSSGSIVVDDLVTDRLNVRLSGSGEIEFFELDAYSLDVRISASGSVFASGIADAQNVVIHSSGRYGARQLDSFTAFVEVSGSGNATVRVRERLRAVVSGSGSIRYFGNPTVERSVTGSGSITHGGP
jgi:hypothetical protein